MLDTSYADALVLRMVQLGAGQQLALRLRLMEIRRNDKRPTDYYLQLGVTCLVPLRSYQVDVQAEFGERPPPRATMIVVVGRASASAPVTLIQDGVPRRVSFTLGVDAATEWVTLWVSPEGVEDIPLHLAGELRLRQTVDELPASELATARLPSLKAVMRQSLMGAFAQSRSPVLVLLGGLMRTVEPFEKRELLSRLLALDADIRFVDAAVRDLAFAEQTERDFPPTDFDRLVTDDVLGGFLAVLHPACPLAVVVRCFTAAFEKQFAATTPATRRRWQELLKTGAVVICRKDRAVFSDDFAAGFAAEPSRAALFRSLVEWAASQATSARRPLAGPAGQYLKQIVDGPVPEAEAAAIELLRHYDLLGPTVAMG